MERVELRSDPPAAAQVRCWHCGLAVAGRRMARYLYPGDRPRTAIVEDWHACSCGAYQNVRRPTEITVSSLARS
jgi:sarcosine oxidase delta subunit